MKQLDLPKKKISLAQVLVNTAIFIVVAILTLSPLITIDLSNSQLRQTVNEGIEMFKDSVEGLENFEVPEKVDVTMGKTLTSAKMMINFINVFLADISDKENYTEKELESLAKSVEALNNALSTEEGRDALVMSIALIGQIVTFEQEESDAEDGSESESATVDPNSITAYVVILVIRGLILFFMVLLVLIYPPILGIFALITLIRALTHLKNPERVVAKVSSVTGVEGLSLAVMLMYMICPFVGFEFGIGLKLIVALACLSILVNICASRLRTYSSLDFKCINIVQGTALAEAVAFVIFFTNSLKAGILNEFVNDISDYLIELEVQTDLINAAQALLNRNYTAFSPSKIYYLDMALIFVYAMFVAGAAMSLAAVLVRNLTLTKTKFRDMRGITYTGVLLLVTSALPIVVSKLQNAIYYTIDDSGVVSIESREAIFTLSESNEKALVWMIIASVAIIVLGIVTGVLKKKFCAEMSYEREMLVMSGNAPIIKDDEAVPSVEPAAENI